MSRTRSSRRLPANLNEIGERGLIIYDGKAYFFVDEQSWRSAGPLNSVPPDFPLPDLEKLGVVFAELKERRDVYVDLDKLPPAQEKAIANQLARQPMEVRQAGDWSILLREGNGLFEVPESTWQPLPAGFEGDAGVLVNRGAVVAAIPRNDIPVGTFCVLVNLDGVI